MGAWTYVCVGCNGLAQSERSHTITCSDVCRIRAHRNGSAKALRALAAGCKIAPAQIQQASALLQIRPDLEAAVIAGTLEIEDAQPEVNRTFVQKLMLKVRAAA
jgi:hypothetical protein